VSSGDDLEEEFEDDRLCCSIIMQDDLRVGAGACAGCCVRALTMEQEWRDGGDSI
jgi:hypothetical protein